MTVQDGWYLVWRDGDIKRIVYLRSEMIDLSLAEPNWSEALEAELLSQATVDAAIAVGKDTPEVTDEEQRHIATAWNCDADIEDVIVVRL